MNRPPLLDASGLRVQVGRRVLFEQLAMRVAPGECWCVLGPNGAGKTRLLEVLAGMRAPAAGQLLYQGTRFERLGVRTAARQRAFLPQHSHDAFAATVFELACSGRHPWLRPGAWEDADDHARVLAALERFGLAGLARRQVHSLSGGERQRLALATVLVQDTPLLLLDEPLNHLDLHQQHAVMASLLDEAHQRSRGIVCTLHDLSLAQACATHVVLLDGRGGHHAGAAAEVLREDRLQDAFDVRLKVLESDGRRHWVVATDGRPPQLS